LATAFDADKAADHRKLPAEEASHTEMWEIVSVVVIDQDGLVPVNAIAPDEAAAKVAWERVVTAPAFAVPAEPGSPVWSFTYVAETAKLVLRKPLSIAFAAFTVLRPTVIGRPPVVRYLLG